MEMILEGRSSLAAAGKTSIPVTFQELMKFNVCGREVNKRRPLVVICFSVYSVQQ